MTYLEQQLLWQAGTHGYVWLQQAYGQSKNTLFATLDATTVNPASYANRSYAFPVRKITNFDSKMVNKTSKFAHNSLIKLKIRRFNREKFRLNL